MRILKPILACFVIFTTFLFSISVFNLTSGIDVQAADESAGVPVLPDKPSGQVEPRIDVITPAPAVDTQKLQFNIDVPQMPANVIMPKDDRPAISQEKANLAPINVQRNYQESYRPSDDRQSYKEDKYLEKKAEFDKKYPNRDMMEYNETDGKKPDFLVGPQDKILPPMPKMDYKELLPKTCQERDMSEPEKCFEHLKANLNLNQAGPQYSDRVGSRTIDVSDPKHSERGQESSKPNFDNFTPLECRQAGVTDEKQCQNLMFSLHMPPECRGQADIKTPEDCEKFMFKKYAPPDCQNLNNHKECEKVMMEKQLPPDCKAKGITTPEDCHKFLDSAFMPKICSDKGAKNKFDCAEIIFSTYGRPEECQAVSDLECRRLIEEGKVKEADDLMAKLDANISPQCQKLGAATFRECEKIMQERNTPPECRQAGAFTREACERVMMEKYQPKTEQMPQACQEAKAKTVAECDKIMTAQYMPTECRDANVADPQQCKEFLAKKNMPPECIAKRAYDRESCEKIMRDQYLTPICKEQGVNDGAACQQMVYAKVAKKFTCQGDLTQEQCEITITKRHIGQIVKKEEDKKQIKENIGQVVGKHLALGKTGLPPGQEKMAAAPTSSIKIEDIAQQIIKILPVVADKETSVLLTPAKEINVITKDETIVSTLPVSISFDDDEDGVTNDMEKRLGTNPNQADSDGDGFKDGKEIQDKQNPAGQGELKYELAPIEEKLMKKEPIEQPITAGKLVEDEFMVLEAVSVSAASKSDSISAPTVPAVPDTPVKSEKTSWFKSMLHTIFVPAHAQTTDTNRENIVLKGKAASSTVVTLYIYGQNSEIPIVATTKTDQSGNWTYTVDKTLKDGEYTVYVAVTDQDGKIVKKSKPFKFLVKGAKSVTAQEFIASTSQLSQDTSVVKWFDRMWSPVEWALLAFGVLAIIAVSTFLIMTYRKGHHHVLSK